MLQSCLHSRGWSPIVLRVTSNSLAYVYGPLRSGLHLTPVSQPLLIAASLNLLQLEEHMVSPLTM